VVFQDDHGGQLTPHQQLRAVWRIFGTVNPAQVTTGLIDEGRNGEYGGSGLKHHALYQHANAKAC
jgi:hypothetical protein